MGSACRPGPILRAFWRFLIVNNLVGSVESPVASKVADTVETAASAVRNVLDRPPTRGT